MANRVQWESSHSVGNATIDAQHKAILAQCNALADCLDEAGDDSDRKFDAIFQDLMARAREHFAAEEALLRRCGYADLDDHQSEQEEYAFLTAEIATTENFDRSELQTFLALWWAGHVVGGAKRYRACLAKLPAA